MAFTNSPLVVHTNLSPNYSVRTGIIDTITPHVVVGHLSLATIGQIFASEEAEASSNYGVNDDGEVGMFVEEKNRSWCSSSRTNDHRAITIEIASDRTHPYAITNGAMDGLIKLAVDICKRNAIPKLLWKADKSLCGQVNLQNISVHRWFDAKACPGDFVYARLGEVATEVNKILVPKPIISPSNPTGALYLVRIATDVLNYRAGPGTNYKVNGEVTKGQVYTIVEESLGLGASKWGRLKSGAGWIALDFCVKLGG